MREHRAKAVRSVAIVVVRLLVQPKRKRCYDNHRAVGAEHSRHFIDEPLRVRRVLEHLYAEDRVECAVLEWEGSTVVVEVRTTTVGGVRRRERGVVLDTNVLGHEWTENDS